DLATICLASSSSTSSEWICEPTPVTFCMPGFLCGTTNHFTNYAFLLGEAEEQPLDTSDRSENVEESVSAGVIIGVVVGAVFLIVVGVIVVGLWLRHLKQQENQDMDATVPTH